MTTDAQELESLPLGEAERVREKLGLIPPRIPDILEELRRGASGEEQRRALIAKIEAARGSRLVCYTALIDAPGSEISPGDVVPLAQVLDQIGFADRLDLNASQRWWRRQHG